MNCSNFNLVVYIFLRFNGSVSGQEVIYLLLKQKEAKLRAFLLLIACVESKAETLATQAELYFPFKCHVTFLFEGKRKQK